MSAGQLDALVAPIALYPDALLSEILMASTYPLEVVEADRWIGANKNLKGDALTAAVGQQSWDDSVKSLVATPDVLDMMSTKLDWTQALGNAVLAQQPDVMDAVQRLRTKAQANNQLASNQQQTVATQDQGGRQVIVIAPAQPDTLYVPYYDPSVVYGPWPYPAYPPYYWPAPGYVAAGIIVTGIAFGAGYALGRWVGGGYWGGGVNWGGNTININNNGTSTSTTSIAATAAITGRTIQRIVRACAMPTPMSRQNSAAIVVVLAAAHRTVWISAAGTAIRCCNRGGRRGRSWRRQPAGARRWHQRAERGGRRQSAKPRQRRQQAECGWWRQQAKPRCRQSSQSRRRWNRGPGAFGNISSGRVANADASRGRASLGGGGGGGGPWWRRRSCRRRRRSARRWRWRRRRWRRRSDMRLKHDIVLLGRLDSGIGFYRFIYNGGSKAYVGVMAQEVRSVMPDAVIRGRDGYLRVDYDKLGLKFQTYDRWIASGARVPATAQHRQQARVS